MPRERERIERLKPKWKVWLEDNGDYVIGPGAFAMLKSISEHGTIAEGAKAIGMSYRYVWGVIKKIENELGVKLLETKKGGSAGGGSATITETGLLLLDKYSSILAAFKEASLKL
jgi:molybdate transport system regulatory protein